MYTQALAEKLSADGSRLDADETLLAINLLMQFFFREAHSNGLVRRFLIKRINKEMQEGVQKGGAAVNKIIKGLKVHPRFIFSSKMQTLLTSHLVWIIPSVRFTMSKWDRRRRPSRASTSTA